MKFQRFVPILSKFSAIGCLAFILSSPQDALAGRIKCWTNDDAVRECGNVIPPQYSQQDHKEINRQGVTVATSRRAKTKDELAEDARRARDEKARAA